MESAELIRQAVAQVNGLRVERQANPHLARSVLCIKQFQSKRFAYTYADLLAGENPQSAGYTQRNAALFFMTELYAASDFTLRDAQFSRIAGTLQKVFPKPVVATAIALAQLHILSEQLDHGMGGILSKTVAGGGLPVEKASATCAIEPGGFAESYVAAWRALGNYQARAQQLQIALQVGLDLDRLTRLPGLRLMLKMMRRPAQAAGMADLQQFLESGFDTFGAMARQGDQAKAFLKTIEARETTLMQALASGPVGQACGLMGSMPQQPSVSFR